MSVLSITAPQFTHEDERLERETMCDEEELAAAYNDLHEGTNYYLENHETPEMMDMGPIELDRAIQNIPLEEKIAYMEALENSPEVVETESNAIMFLRSENYNVWAAAERLVNYWELRRWLFGDRAFLPMTQTGDGALNEYDIQLLHLVPVTLLQHPDEMGRRVLYIEESRLFNNHQHENEMVPDFDRLGFDYHTSRFDRKYYKYLTYLFCGYHVVNTRAFHVCAPPGKSCFLLVLPFIKYFMTKHLRLRFKLHKGTNREVAIDLADFGIKKENLPESMTGSYKFESFQEWVQERLSYEMQREIDLVVLHKKLIANRVPEERSFHYEGDICDGTTT